jgi:hypothetical protein
MVDWWMMVVGVLLLCLVLRCALQRCVRCALQVLPQPQPSHLPPL